MSIEIGLIGVGPWGVNILRDLKSLGVNVHCCARSEESKSRARQGGAASIVSRPEELSSACEGYVVANRATSHVAAIKAILPRGRPIFCEKPLSNDLNAALALPDEAHRLVFVMHKWRYHPAIIELARIARSGDLGPVVGLRTFRCGEKHNHPDVSQLWVLAPHDFSIALEILGETPQPIAAFRDSLAQGGALARAVTRDGIPFVMEVSSGHLRNLRRILLRCRDAVVEVDSDDYARVRVLPQVGARYDIVVSDELPLLAELRTFLNHVRGGPPPLTALRDEIEVIAAIGAIEAMISDQ